MGPTRRLSPLEVLLETAQHAIERRGVVALIERDDRLLVIKRSMQVVAPGAYCFPGGGIEADETERQALVRELREELGVGSRPVRRIWQSVTPWRVHLGWWKAELETTALALNPAEVAAAHWLTIAEILALPELLESNRHFFAALDRGEFDLA